MKKLRLYQKINLRRAPRNKNENWMFEKLKTTGFYWQRQRLFAYRIFDFFCPEIGIAVEVDGSEHDIEKDRKRDLEYFNKFAIDTLRVRNGNEDDAEKALMAISISEQWAERKIQVLPKLKKRVVFECMASRMAKKPHIKGWQIIRKESE